MKKCCQVMLALAMSYMQLSAAESYLATALKTEQPPQLDGKLDEPFWQTAKPLGQFLLWTKADRGKPTDATEVKLAYDDTWLYLGMTCSNPLQKLIMAPKVREHDGSIQADESLELFLTSDQRGKVYYHFLLSCFNVKAEQRFIEGQRERSTWNLPWRSATVITDKGWTTEIAIPLYLFLEHGDFEHVRMNIARNRRCPQMDACNVITHDVMEASLWRPVKSSFHETEAFGMLAPLTPSKLQVPFLVSLETATITPYSLKDGTNQYGVEITLKGANNTDGEVEVIVTDKPASGEAVTVRERVALKGTTPHKLTLAVPAPVPSERVITVEARDTKSGEIYRTVTIENPAVLKIMEAYLDRNYYTTEKEAVAVAELAMPAESLSDMMVALIIDGKEAGRAPAASETRVQVPIGDVPVGTQAVTIALQRPDGAAFYKVAAELIKRAPKPGREVKIDQINRVVLKDGVPFFPFGPVMAGIKPKDEVDFEKIAKAGCNTFFQWHTGVTATNADAFLETAKKHGLYATSQLETGWRAPKESGLALPQKLLSAKDAESLLGISRGGTLPIRGYLMRSELSRYPNPVKTDIFRECVNQNLPVTEQVVQNVMNAENLTAYFSFDEPFDSHLFDMTQSLDAIYRLTQRTDGYHPVILNYSSYIPEGDEYVTCCDILCTDPYWIPGGDSSSAGRTTPNFVSKIVYWNDQRAVKFRKAVWIVPVAWRWSGCRKRGITLAEQDCQNFLAIIHGARGLFWFAYPMPPAAWENLKVAIAKVKVVGPMAVQPKVAQTVRHLRATATEPELKDAPFLPEKEEFPDVQGRVFRNPAGGLVLLAVNSRYYPVKITVTVEGLSGTVSNLFGGAALPVREGAFTETIEPFAVRAWNLGAGLKEPVSVTLAAVRPAEIPPPETAHPGNARAGKKNVFPNPSFEDETVPGCADYYFGGTLVTDAASAKSGKNYLKLVNDNPDKVYTQVQWHCGPHIDQDTVYTWSFWAKGAKGGEKIWLRAIEENGRIGESKNFFLTTEWKRYDIPVTIYARAKPQLFDIRIWCQGEAWLDGLQMEEGNNTTEFEE